MILQVWHLRLILKQFSVMMSLGILMLAGCATGHLATAPHSVPGAVAVPPPMTLPRFLGIDSVVHGVQRTMVCARLRLSPLLPVLEPLPAGAGPMALADPNNLQSPAPAVAAAASVQQAEAAAPGKIKALAYLASVDCGRHPQVEEAMLAGLEDPSDAVRIAAIQSIIDSSTTCGQRSCGCGGCCTPAIRTRLTQMAFERNPQDCWCEPNARARRMARIALEGCGGPAIAPPVDCPAELPPQEILIQLQSGPTPPAS